jgi:7-keto-8-aminopelargonate synthetase-like enzyme
VISDVEELDELWAHGRSRSVRMISGPQGPRVLLDGQPVLMLCSSNHLGLADHPRVREAAADAAMRWGAGAGSSRLVSGTMTIHRRFEERMADFHATERCLLFGSGHLAAAGIVPALARAGEVVLYDERCGAGIADGCRLAGAEAFAFRHNDLDHLASALREVGGRASLVATEGLFGLDGTLAPLPELVELAHRHDARLVVDEGRAIGALGPCGRGAVAGAGLEDEVDVVIGTLGTALGSYGGYVCCDATTAGMMVSRAHTFAHSTALAPPSAAAALAALELLEREAGRVERLDRNARVLRESLSVEGVSAPLSDSHLQLLPLGSAHSAEAAFEQAVQRGILVRLVGAPLLPDGMAGLHVSVMASHTKAELHWAAGILSEIVAEHRRAAPVPLAVAAPTGVFDGLREAA